MSRIYEVSSTHETRLVRANSQAQALSHVARSEYSVKVATQDDLVSGLTSGKTVEQAGVEPAVAGEPQA